MNARTRQRSVRRPPRKVEQLALLGAAVVAAIAVGWAMMRVAGNDDDPLPGEIAGDPGVAHVHGLGLNPADGSLIVATHHGSFRVAPDGDRAERIGESFQDTMGFTVAGPDHFLGSGHPDLQGSQAGQPGRLGLIESTDAGTTWTILSLGDEVDFHALAFAHDQVYGWDSGTGRFMVSRDRTEWETRATLDLFGFAVDPDDADHIVGAGPDGLVESTDGGREWAGSDGPPMVAVSWDTEAGLWGADPGGIVWRHAGDGWERTGRVPGQPQAFLATADALYAAVHGEDDRSAIYRSADDGRTWDLHFSDTAR